MPSPQSPGYLLNPNSAAVLLSSQSALVADTAAVVTLTALPGVRHQPLFISVGWNVTATVAAGGPSLTVAWTQAGAAKTFVYYVGLAAGSQQINLPHGLVGDVNTEMSFTLSAANNGAIGSVFVLYGGT